MERPRRQRMRLRERDRFFRNLEYLHEDLVKNRIDRLYDLVFKLYQEVEKLKEK